jgi:hypothetical protein
MNFWNNSEVTMPHLGPIAYEIQFTRGADCIVEGQSERITGQGLVARDISGSLGRQPRSYRSHQTITAKNAVAELTLNPDSSTSFRSSRSI